MFASFFAILKESSILEFLSLNLYLPDIVRYGDRGKVIGCVQDLSVDEAY